MAPAKKSASTAVASATETVVDSSTSTVEPVKDVVPPAGKHRRKSSSVGSDVVLYKPEELSKYSSSIDVSRDGLMDIGPILTE